LFIQYITLSTF